MSEIPSATITELFYDTDLMAALCADVIPQRPAGFGVTADEFAEQSGLSVSTARRKLLEMKENGKLDETQMLQNGGRVGVFHYFTE